MAGRDGMPVDQNRDSCRELHLVSMHRLCSFDWRSLGANGDDAYSNYSPALALLG